MPSIMKHLPKSFNNYFEPFVGGGALFFEIHERLEQATLVDNNFELVMAYKAIQKEPRELVKQLREHKKKHSSEYYYKVRKQNLKDPIKIASRFLYLNKTCFNGLYRVNKSGGFNAPIGRYKNPNIVQEDNILLVHEVLKKAAIRLGDFETIEPDKGDFAYFDPPYHPTDETSFTEYTKENFTERDQVRLRDFILKLHKKGVKIMLSNSDTRFVKEIYKHKAFTQHKVKAPRYVNCKPDDRGKVTELLITNY